MSDKLNFQENEIRLASLRLAIENNSMLRLLLNNQMKIMEKLEIESGFPESVKSISNTLIPGRKNEDDDYNPVINEAVDILSELIQKRAWEWAKMNLGKHDNQ